MKYNNYALSLILLASFAFASPSFPSDEELETLAGQVISALPVDPSHKKKRPIIDKHFDIEEIKNLNLSGRQKEKLKGANYKDKSVILKVLKNARNEEISEIAEFIANKADGKNVSLGDSAIYDGKLTAEQIETIREFEQNTGGWPLNKDELKTFLRENTLPTPLPRVEKILKIADSGKISDKDVSLYGVDLDTTQYQTIEKFETLSGRAVTETELSDYLDNGILLPFTVDQRLDAIKALPAGKVGETTEIKGFATAKQIQVIIAKEAEFNGRIADDLLEKILKATNDTELDELAKPIDVPPPALPETNSEKVAFILALTAPDVKLTGIDKSLYREIVGDKEIAAIAAKENETGKKITDSELLFILTNPAGSDEAESTGEPEPTRTEDLATKVFAHAKNGKFEEASRPALLKLGVTEAQINKLIAAAGLDTKEKVDAVLKSATESNPEAASTTTPASAAADVSTQILNLALGNNKQLDATKHEAVLKGLLLNEAQIKALLSAKDLDSKDKVQNIITANATPKERTPAEIAAEVLSKYVKDGKIEATHRASLEALQISAAQIDELFKATGLDVAKIENILKVPVTPAAPAAPTKIDFAAIFELVSGGKIAESSKAALKALGLNDTQVDLILKASGLDSVAKIEQLLQPSKPGKPEEVSSNASNTGNIAANADPKDEGSLLTNPWILGIGAVVLVAAIGGGAYFMTRKTDETEL